MLLTQNIKGTRGRDAGEEADKSAGGGGLQKEKAIFVFRPFATEMVVN